MRAKLFFILFFIFSCSSTTHEVPTPLFSKKQLWDKGSMVSAANPHAVDAAVDILNMGGSAVDAAIGACCFGSSGTTEFWTWWWWFYAQL